MGTIVEHPAAGSAANTDHILAPFERDVLLTTGRAVRVRPAGSSDVPGLRAFYDGLSDTSTYYRFFGLRRFIPTDELTDATVQDVRRNVTLIAEAGHGLIGIGEYHALPGGEEAEVAFAVSDAHQHEGIGTVLLEDLATIARSAGFRRLVASTMPGNTPMRRVFGTVGLVTREWFADGVVHVQLDLTTDDLMQDDADLRDWRSAVESLRPILQPSHVVVVGASRDGNGPGRRILDHVRASFTGRTSAVHPSAPAIAAVQTVRRVGDLDPVPDLAIIAVPAVAVAGVVDECGRAGVAAAVVISAGFAEQDDVGRRRQEEVLALARSHGMRIVGPNCLGVVSTRCGLNATFTAQCFLPGGIAIAAQSGGVGIAIAAEAEHRHAGVSAFVSMGNKVDVSSNDLLRLWADDDDTNVVLLYLESFGDPMRFARVARAVSQRMPIVALKGGRTDAGRRGARSHTAALATDQVVVDALFAHTGVVRAKTLEELVDVGLLFDRQPPPAGSRVAFIGNAGGPLILGADTAADRDLVVPELSEGLRHTIAALVPAAAATANPIDLTSAMNGDQLTAVTRAIADSGEVDACIVVVVDVDASSRDITGPLSTLDAPVPIAVARAGSPHVDERLPVYPSAERAAVAVALAARRARWLQAIADDPADERATSDVAAALAIARSIARRGPTADGWLEPGAAFELVSSAGVPVAPWRYVRSATECARAAGDVGTPCVVKGDVEQLVHKSDEGAVLLGVTDAEQATTAYSDLLGRFGDRLRGAVVQAQAAPGLELLIGIARHPGFGPVLVVGAGGTEAELRNDRAVLVAPVSAAAATRAIDGLQLAPLLHGYRGRAPLPAEKVADLVHRVSLLAIAVPEIDQLDLNPVIVDPDGCVVVDARVAVTADESSATPLRGMRGHSGRPATADP